MSKSLLDPVPQTPGRGQIVDLYTEALSRLKNIISGDYSSIVYDRNMSEIEIKRNAASKILEIQKHIKFLKKENIAWAKKYIPEAYKNGIYQDKKILKQYLGSKYKGSFTQLHRDAAMVAIEGAVQDFNTISDSLENTFVGYIRRAQISGLRTKVAEEIAKGIVEGVSRETVSKRLLKDLRIRAIEGKITIGNTTMNVKSYADTLARTLSRAARTEGTINRLIENDIDLVKVSNTGAIDFCTIYEDQIFSISGRSKRFPKLMARTPYHPNCTHTMSAFITEYAAEGEIEAGSRFKDSDNGLTSKELNKKYPIPKSKRKAA